MLPAARIQAVIELLENVFSQQKPADSLASDYFRNRRFIGSSDRAGISTRFYRILRSFHRLSWWIERHDVEVNPRTLVIADLIIGGEHSARSLADAFDGGRYTPNILSKSEERLAKGLEGCKIIHADMEDVVRLECPVWAGEKLKNSLGQDFEAELQAMLSPAPLDLRVNTINATREEVMKRLKSDGLEPKAGQHSPYAIRLYDRPPIAQHDVFKQGMIEIQDEGSQMVAVLADAKPGEQVVDFCAGAGGKTLAMAASMNNKGRLIAMDVLERRLQRAKLRFRRAGVHNIETRPLTSERDKWVKRHQAQFDLVLVDAPCSGTGTWRRDPDKRWRMLGPGLEALVPLQASILSSAARLVKPGGRLVYATCSLLREENEDQIDTFVKENPEFEVRPARDVVTFIEGDYLKMSPGRHDTDGFFASLLVRKSKD